MGIIARRGLARPAGGNLLGMSARFSPTLLAVIALAALGCSKSPTVTLSAADHPKYPQPEPLAAAMSGTLHKAILTCYRDAGTETTGTAVVNVQGSHGLLDLTVLTSSGDTTLDGCVTGSISNGRMSREIGDTDHHIGFVLTTTYAYE